MKESTKLEWNGDVDLADGCVQKQHEKYRQHLDQAEKVGLNHASAARELEDVIATLKKDLEFLHTGNVYSLMLFRY